MRLLAFSDIHNNLVAVRKLRASEKNSYDAIIVAGDIGNEGAVDFFKILATFRCPVMYVYGNWDKELGYNTAFGDACHLIQSNVITIGNISFTGFSGCPTNWGKNPFYKNHARQGQPDERRVLQLNREDRSPQMCGHNARTPSAAQRGSPRRTPPSFRPPSHILRPNFQDNEIC
jgi:hypothetical protein